jgi:hypothetical protein
VLWWSGAEEKDTLPEGLFDLAYSLRASDWRGRPQVHMEFVDFRNLAGQPVEINRCQLEVIDYRNARELSKILSTLREGSSILVWAEGDQKKGIGGKDRNELAPAEALAIWTIPPSPQELHFALDKVHPKTIYLFGATDPVITAEALIGRLSGLLKYAINHHAGNVTWSELAAATAQRLVTVRKGLEWLVLLGEIDIKTEKENELVVSIGASLKDSASASSTWSEMQSLLAETSAYRAHFKRADKDKLFSV